MEGTAESGSDKKDGEDSSGSEKIARASASGSDKKAVHKLHSRLSADAPAFIPRGYHLATQGRGDRAPSTQGGKAGGGVTYPSPSPSLVTPSTASPVPTPSSGSASSGSAGGRLQIPVAAPPGKGHASTTDTASSHDHRRQRRGSDSRPTRGGKAGGGVNYRPPAPSPVTPSTAFLVPTPSSGSVSSGSTGGRPQIPAAAPPGKGHDSSTDTAGSHDHRRRRQSSNPPLQPQNLGPRFSPASSMPEGPAYALVLQHGPAAAAELMKYKNDMLRYLNHEDCAHYKEEASRLGRRLTIDFVDLMWKEKKLAENICNNRGSNAVWLKEAAKTFFESNGLPSGNVSFEFKDIPSRLWPARVYMETLTRVHERSICGGIARIHEATPHGRRGADLILTGILDCLSKGVSWLGKLTLEDLWFGEKPDGSLQLYIAKQPVHIANAPTSERLLDVHSIWPAIKGALGLVDGKLPLYFLQLKEDLEDAKYLPDWYFPYLRFHPALYGSMPRRHFVTSLKKSVKRFKATSSDLFNRVFSGSPLRDDWRNRAAEGALKLLLKFSLLEKKKPDKKRDSNTTLKSSGGAKKECSGQVDKSTEVLSDNITRTSDVTKTSGGSSGNIVLPSQDKDAASSPERAINYADTTVSLVDYVRNGLQHLDQYLESKDDDEIELYLAMIFPEILPIVIRGLLDACGMGGCFDSAWDTYKKSK